MSYSQNAEDQFVLNHFGDFKGTLLEIGANDGQTFSNSKLLIENGWVGHLVEPGNVYKKLQALHKWNEFVYCYNVGIGTVDDYATLYESGAHVPNGKDVGLVSTFDFEETKRWPGVTFEKTEIELMTWESFYTMYTPGAKFDFISIDAEGFDFAILQQIDLDAVGCKCLCIEWNSDPVLLELFSNYCIGFKIAVQNGENLIFIRYI